MAALHRWLIFWTIDSDERSGDMKRPVRPFVVEFKKKRSSTSKQRSIWGDIDLSAVATEPSNEPMQADQSNTDAPDRTSCEVLDPMPTGNPSETTAVDRVDLRDDVGGGEGEGDGLGANTQNDAGIPSRLDGRRKRRPGEPMLPRGQRWKRRLPKALRRLT